MKIGFIGLGIMGSRMAQNLLSAGYDLTINNRSPQKAQALREQGARWADSPAELAPAVDILWTMLSTPEAVQAVATGKNGFLNALPEGVVWVNSSTVDPDFARQMANLANEKNVHYVDAPVTGTKGPAASGDLVFLLGGADEDIKKCQSLLDSMGKKSIHLGEAGQGSSMKMLFNMMLGSAMAAYSETLALGEAFGFSMETLAKALGEAPVTAPFLKMKHSLIEKNDFEAHFPLCWMRKDLHLAADAAYKNGVVLPAMNSVKELYGLAEKQGLGQDDFSAVYRLLTEDLS